VERDSVADCKNDATTRVYDKAVMMFSWAVAWISRALGPVVSDHTQAHGPILGCETAPDGSQLLHTAD
jgi:hypothetical protein